MKAALVPLCIYTEVFTATIRNKNTGATYARVVGNFRQQCVTGLVFVIVGELRVLVT